MFFLHCALILIWDKNNVLKKNENFLSFQCRDLKKKVVTAQIKIRKNDIMAVSLNLIR